MTVLIFSLFAAALLPYIAKIPVAIAMNREGGYDNNHPRDQQAKLRGFGARALAAHQNSFESFIVFSSAILLAIATETVNDTIEILAITHIVARVIYHILYLINIGILRSLSWGAGIACSFIIMMQCI